MGKVLVEALVNDKGADAVQDERDTAYFSETDGAGGCLRRCLQDREIPNSESSANF